MHEWAYRITVKPEEAHSSPLLSHLGIFKTALFQALGPQGFAKVLSCPRLGPPKIIFSSIVVPKPPRRLFLCSLNALKPENNMKTNDLQALTPPKTWNNQGE